MWYKITVSHFEERDRMFAFETETLIPDEIIQEFKAANPEYVTSSGYFVRVENTYPDGITIASMIEEYERYTQVSQRHSGVWRASTEICKWLSWTKSYVLQACKREAIRAIDVTKQAVIDVSVLDDPDLTEYLEDKLQVYTYFVSQLKIVEGNKK